MIIVSLAQMSQSAGCARVRNEQMFNLHLKFGAMSQHPLAPVGHQPNPLIQFV